MRAVVDGRRHAHVPVARRLTVYRWKQFLVLAMVGAVLSTVVVGVLGIRDSASGAIEDSVRADQAGRAFAVQGGPQVAREVLDGTAALEPVSETRGDIVAPDLQVPALIRTVRNAGLPLGALIEGRRPQESSEVTLTRATAESLEVGLGGTVRTATDSATSAALRVVGITADPADRDALGAVVVDPDLDPASATVWLSDTDPYSLSQLQPVLDQRLATYQSVESLVAASEARLPGELQDLRYAGWGLAALLLLFLATSVVTLAPVARADAEALQAAGVPASEAWGLLTRLVVTAVVVGQFLGGA